MTLTKWLGIACSKNSCNTPVENRCSTLSVTYSVQYILPCLSPQWVARRNPYGLLFHIYILTIYSQALKELAIQNPFPLFSPIVSLFLKSGFIYLHLHFTTMAPRTTAFPTFWFWKIIKFHISIQGIFTSLYFSMLFLTFVPFLLLPSSHSSDNCTVAF